MWTTELTERLIAEYRQQSALWEVTSPEYKDNGTRARAWITLAKAMGVDVPEVQRKIHNLRNQWNAEHQRASMRRASEGEGAKGSRWRHYEALSFIRPFIEARRAKVRMEQELFLSSSISSTSSSAQMNYVETGEVSEAGEVCGDTGDLLTVKAELQSPPPEYPPEVPPMTLTPSCTVTRKRKLPEPAVEEGSEVTGSSTLRDEYAIFGEYVASELRLVRDRNALALAKYKINNVLFEATSGLLGVQ